MTTEAQKRASTKYRKKHMEYYNMKSKESAKKMRQERAMYKERCEEALTYIAKLRNDLEFDKNQFYMVESEVDHLEEILGGERRGTK